VNFPFLIDTYIGPSLEINFLQIKDADDVVTITCNVMVLFIAAIHIFMDETNKELSMQPQYEIIGKKVKEGRSRYDFFLFWNCKVSQIFGQITNARSFIPGSRGSYLHHPIGFA
jgi:hypothetical protein